MYLHLVLLKLNISTCSPNKCYGQKHALQSSDSSAATEFHIKSHFYSTLSNAAHYMRPGTQAPNVELIKLTQYRS